MPMSAAGQAAHCAFVAARARAISALHQERCSLRISCPCAAISRPSRSSPNEVKGKSALAISRDLGLSYKTAFVLLHKFREAMAAELRGRVIGGNGKVAE